MRKVIVSDYIIALTTGNIGIEITEAEYNEILDLIRNKPQAESGFDYRLKSNLTWELYELPQIEEPQAYTEEQLSTMTNAELEAVCAELGINPNKNKANMIRLIMYKQNTTD